MTTEDTQSAPPSWRTFANPILVALIVFIPLIIRQNGVDIFYVFLVIPALLVFGVGILIYAAFHKNLRVASMLLIFWAASAFFLLHSTDIRTAFRWLLWSREYKRQVVAQTDSPNGDFKHIEWDGWGFAGMGSSVFLVFDPSDRLRATERSYQPRKAVISECEGIESVVHRLENHWFIVTCTY
jgi:hypothetical protein